MSPGRDRWIPFSERIPAPDTGQLALGLAAALVVGHLGLLAAGLVPSAWAFVVLGVALAGVEIAFAVYAPFGAWAFDRIGAGAGWRGLVRGVALLLLLVRSDAPVGWIVLAGGAVLVVHGLRVAGSGLAELSRLQRRMPIVTRGLSLAPVRLPAAPPTALARQSDEALSWPDLVLVAGAAAAVLSGSFAVLVTGAAVAAVLVAAGDAVLARAVLAMRRIPAERFEAAVHRALAKVAPKVALYFGSGPETLYQLEMWVETVEQLDVPAVVVLRDREALRQLGPTRLPVLCVERGTVLMALPLPELRLALYVAHAASNLHLLRRPGVQHVFVGHGDSDKTVSANPFLKAYDEVWVSGPAARDRLRAAGVGVQDGRVVEIGRPQLDMLALSQRPEEEEPRRLTVLYAPTWEGYADEPHQTSLSGCGAELVRLLLAESDVRVIYRPHPLAGSRDPAVGAVHEEIVELLGVGAAPTPVPPPDGLAAARDDLDVAATPVDTSRQEQLAAQEVWTRRQLVPDPVGVSHRLAPAPQFGLYACFAAADVLLCDVSSVISDFVATGKPYAVVNAGGLPAGDFAVRYPSSRGGYLVDPDGHGLAGLLSAGRGEGDPAAETRAVLREQLLGKPEPAALERMRRAVGRVLDGPD